jgi:hypothetical protein
MGRLTTRSLRRRSSVWRFSDSIYTRKLSLRGSAYLNPCEPIFNSPGARRAS